MAAAGVMPRVSAAALVVVSRGLARKARFELFELVGFAGFSQFALESFEHLVQKRQHPAPLVELFGR